MPYPYPFIEEMMPLWYIFICIFGLCFGSFLNVCISRMPRRESIVFTSSYCPKCKYKIKWYENIPVLSWLFLRGHCSNCKKYISIRYVLVEVLSGLLVLLAWWRIVELHYPLSLFLFYLLASFLFIVTFFIDLKHKIIPNRLTYSVIVLSLILSFLFPQAMMENNSISALKNSLLGLLFAAVVLGFVKIAGKFILKKEISGWGDIKFIAAVGACFGLYPAVWFFCLLVGSILGTLLGIFLMLLRKSNLSTELPFGAFLSVAGYLWILYGTELVKSYVKIIESYF